MSTETTTPPEAPVDTKRTHGPGGELRQARLDLKLAPEDVAKMLHLSERQIVAIENEDYDSLPGPTYVRGYLRGYAQLLGVSAEPLVQSYNRLVAKRKPEDLGKLAPKPEMRSDHQLVKFATIAVIVIVVGLSAVWWQEKPEPAVESSQPEAAVPTDTAEAPPIEGVPEYETPFGGDAARPAVADAAPAPEMASLPKPAPVAPVVPAQAEDVQSAATVSPEPVTQSASVVPPTPSPIAGPRGRLVLQATLDCWADVRDARGERLLYDTIPAGRSIALEGATPLFVFLGNVEGVRVEFNGETYDASAHRRGDIARFTLGQAKRTP